MVSVSGGSFMMGATKEEFGDRLNEFADLYFNESPRHRVSVTPFLLGRYDVTRSQFRAFAVATGFHGSGCHIPKNHGFTFDPHADWEHPGFPQSESDPVVCVSWVDAQKFIAWLNTRVVGVLYRLPSEAEWEYAARAGIDSPTYWGERRNNQCKYENTHDEAARRIGLDVIDHQTPNVTCNDGYVYTSPVGVFLPNPWGFSDMLGNVYQWTADCSVIGFRTLATSDLNLGCITTRRVKGASWASPPIHVRAAYRLGQREDERRSTVGFRVAGETH
jgi:formylglycine-generating enzyme